MLLSDAADATADKELGSPEARGTFSIWCDKEIDVVRGAMRPRKYRFPSVCVLLEVNFA